jgi:hypothetical protein
MLAFIGFFIGGTGLLSIAVGLSDMRHKDHVWKREIIGGSILLLIGIAVGLI